MKKTAISLFFLCFFLPNCVILFGMKSKKELIKKTVEETFEGIKEQINSLVFKKDKYQNYILVLRLDEILIKIDGSSSPDEDNKNSDWINLLKDKGVDVIGLTSLNLKEKVDKEEVDKEEVNLNFIIKTLEQRGIKLQSEKKGPLNKNYTEKSFVYFGNVLCSKNVEAPLCITIRKTDFTRIETKVDGNGVEESKSFSKEEGSQEEKLKLTGISQALFNFINKLADEGSINFKNLIFIFIDMNSECIKSVKQIVKVLNLYEKQFRIEFHSFKI